MGKRLDQEGLAKAFATLDIHNYGDVVQCMRCGSCLPRCPTYRTDGIETQSPGGRVAMIKAVMDGRLAPSEEFVEHMYTALIAAIVRAYVRRESRLENWFWRRGKGSKKTGSSPFSNITCSITRLLTSRNSPGSWRLCGCTRTWAYSGLSESPDSWSGFHLISDLWKLSYPPSLIGLWATRYRRKYLRKEKKEGEWVFFSGAP